MNKKLFVAAFFIFSGFTTAGQTKDEEIKKLQTLLKESEERAIKAESTARQALNKAYRAEQSMNRGIYLGIARELTYSIMDLSDKELIALLALQSYNFNKEYKGNLHDIRITEALKYVVRKYDLEADKKSGEQLANVICSLVTRNLSNKEWNIYIGDQFMYEKTCQNYPASIK